MLLLKLNTIQRLFVGVNLNNCIQVRTKVIYHLPPTKITELLSENEICLNGKDVLPTCIKSIECNQLASNNPIEDRLRISSLHLPGFSEPTLILGVFDGHGGGTTADLISRRLFNYVAISLHPELSKLKISNHNEMKKIVVDLHNSPKKFNEDSRLQAVEFDMLSCYKNELVTTCGSNGSAQIMDIAANIKASFQRCDDDLSREIQESLITSTHLNQQMLRHYLSAAVSGCCAIVMVIHQGIAYVASTGDCRAVLGIHEKQETSNKNITNTNKTHAEQSKIGTLKALELNDEHNCDNINEIRRLAASHPKSEQNTIIRHNRLLGHLMPFRAFGDFNYKWPADIIRACGITRAYGAGVIPSNYETPPYLIVEPDIKTIQVDKNRYQCANETERSLVNNFEHVGSQDKYLVMATDGLWELFESSRDVVETIIDHSNNASQQGNEEDYDANCATYILRSALQSGPYQDISLDPERLRKLHHIRLESTLTLPKSVVRNFRDDISIILLKLQ